MFIGEIPKEPMKAVKTAYKRFILKHNEVESSAKSKEDATSDDWNETKNGKKDSESSNTRRSRR
jgi:hypothetical protein